MLVEGLYRVFELSFLIVFVKKCTGITTCDFYKAPIGENCPKNEIITIKDSCENVALALGLELTQY